MNTRPTPLRAIAALTLHANLAAAVPPPCQGDLNTDGMVDSADLNTLLAAFGQEPDGDIDGDGATTSADLNLLLADFGCQSVPPTTGACCISAASGCTPETPEECGFLGGTFLGLGTDCADADCQSVYGACCTAVLVGECLDGVTAELCAFMGGKAAFYGQGSTCAGVTDCTPGACCIDGACFQMTGFECDEFAGVFLGIGVPCAGAPCAP